GVRSRKADADLRGALDARALARAGLELAVGLALDIADQALATWRRVVDDRKTRTLVGHMSRVEPEVDAESEVDERHDQQGHQRQREPELDECLAGLTPEPGDEMRFEGMH